MSGFGQVIEFEKLLNMNTNDFQYFVLMETTYTIRGIICRLLICAIFEGQFYNMYSTSPKHFSPKILESIKKYKKFLKHFNSIKEVNRILTINSLNYLYLYTSRLEVTNKNKFKRIINISLNIYVLIFL